MKHTAFALCIQPDAPVILGRRLNLCAFLAHRLLDELRGEGVPEPEAIRRAHAEIPLAESHGVFCGSSAMIARCPTSVHTVTASMERHLVMVPEVESLIQPNARTRSNSREFDNVTKRYQNLLTRYQQYHTEPEAGVWFVGYGDRDRVETLVSDLKVFGTKRRAVRQVLLYNAEPTAVTGILAHDGTVLRPVPCASRLKPKNFAISEERWRPPYWKGPVTRCFIPPVMVWDNEAQITDLIGVIG